MPWWGGQRGRGLRKLVTLYPDKKQMLVTLYPDKQRDECMHAAELFSMYRGLSWGMRPPIKIRSHVSSLS